jgi:hypothetical protein
VRHSHAFLQCFICKGVLGTRLHCCSVTSILIEQPVRRFAYFTEYFTAQSG